MALKDILGTQNNSNFANRGNIGVIKDVLAIRLSHYLFIADKGGRGTVTASFKNGASVNFPNGTIIYAFHLASRQLVGQGTISAGSVTINVTTSDSVFLVSDPAAAGLLGETVCTTSITPA